MAGFFSTKLSKYFDITNCLYKFVLIIIHTIMAKKQQNKFKCPQAIWRKFSEKQREVYNNIRSIDNSVIHPGVPLDANVFSTISHNYACLAAWEVK